MSYPKDPNDSSLIVDLIEHAIVSNAQAPFVGASCELFASARPRVLLQPGECPQDSPGNAVRQAIKITTGGRPQDDRILRPSIHLDLARC